MPEGHQLGDAPIAHEYRETMQRLAHALDTIFNGKAKDEKRQTGFVLLVFPFGEEGRADQTRCNFISNGANREDIVALFKELIARFEGQPETKPGRA